MEYTLKEFAQMFDTTEHTVRFYTDIGLLPCSPQGVQRRVRKPDAGDNLPKELRRFNKGGLVYGEKSKALRADTGGNASRRHKPRALGEEKERKNQRAAFTEVRF